MAFRPYESPLLVTREVIEILVAAGLKREDAVRQFYRAMENRDLSFQDLTASGVWAEGADRLVRRADVYRVWELEPDIGEVAESQEIQTTSPKTSPSSATSPKKSPQSEKLPKASPKEVEDAARPHKGVPFAILWFRVKEALPTKDVPRQIVLDAQGALWGRPGRGNRSGRSPK
jgi:hypothetical protein